MKTKEGQLPLRVNLRRGRAMTSPGQNASKGVGEKNKGKGYVRDLEIIQELRVLDTKTEDAVRVWSLSST